LKEAVNGAASSSTIAKQTGSVAKRDLLMNDPCPVLIIKIMVTGLHISSAFYIPGFPSMAPDNFGMNIIRNIHSGVQGEDRSGMAGCPGANGSFSLV
jgi:hypothetical protein